ncbi:FAD-dependent oxidoreductase [Candidatus Parcubacteria bacterium]|nr:FAD-dependent oxidoreductase [Candidatus Parcubacteria bacterium]
MEEKNFDLIIIGGGPAGITAGIYASRQNLKTLLITKEWGGQLSKKATKIENYPGFKSISGQELIQKFVDQLMAQDIGILIDEVTKVEKIGEDFLVKVKSQKEFKSKTVIVASGMDPRQLKVKGEMEFLGRGVSYCVTCDGPLFKKKSVAVIGGGNAGFEAALFLAKIAKKVYILEASEEIRADAQNQKLAKETGKIEILTSIEIREIKGEKFVKSILCFDKKNQKEFEISVDGIFVEIGGIPATSFVKGLVDFNERNEILVDFETMATKTPGLFAAGDCNVGKYKQIVTACGEGAKAALAAHDYLRKLKTKNETKN